MIKKVNTIVKRLLLWWDPDFTKVTPKERKALEDADKEMKNGEYFTDDEVWNNEQAMFNHSLLKLLNITRGKVSYLETYIVVTF